MIPLTPVIQKPVNIPALVLRVPTIVSSHAPAAQVPIPSPAAPNPSGPDLVYPDFDDPVLA